MIVVEEIIYPCLEGVRGHRLSEKRRRPGPYVPNCPFLTYKEVLFLGPLSPQSDRGRLTSFPERHVVL